MVDRIDSELHFKLFSAPEGYESVEGQDLDTDLAGIVAVLESDFSRLVKIALYVLSYGRDAFQETHSIAQYLGEVTVELPTN